LTVVGDLDRAPEYVRERLDEGLARVETLLEEARTLLRTQLPGKVSFELSEPAREPLLTSTERAQLIDLVIRYDGLPDPPSLQLVRKSGRFHIANLRDLRSALSEYRPFILKSGDSLHYARLHSWWSRRRGRAGEPPQLRVRARDGAGAGHTSDDTKWLTERKKAIAHVVAALDYPYVYDGVLRHVEQAHSERFLREYETGAVNHVLWTHVVPLGFFRQMLWPYSRLAKALTPAGMGGL
jgi:hypothetical protein